MAGKSKKEYPFKVIGFLPKGHPFGVKNRESFRSTLHRSEESADREIGAYDKMGVKSQKFKR